MINANELRIGNWVEANSPPMQVVLIHKYGADMLMPDSESDPWAEDFEDISPIPLTPEILEKCGFVFNGIEKLYVNGKSIIGDASSEPRYNCIDKEFYFIIQADYYGGCGVQLISLHQLQNLYYALTGTELNYKP